MQESWTGDGEDDVINIQEEVHHVTVTLVNEQQGIRLGLIETQ